MNLYGFVGNRPGDRWDPFGLSPYSNPASQAFHPLADRPFARLLLYSLPESVTSDRNLKMAQDAAVFVATVNLSLATGTFVVEGVAAAGWGSIAANAAAGYAGGVTNLVISTVSTGQIPSPGTIATHLAISTAAGGALGWAGNANAIPELIGDAARIEAALFPEPAFNTYVPATGTALDQGIASAAGDAYAMQASSTSPLLSGGGAPAAEGALGVAARVEATEASVADKLSRYLLNPEHPVGGPKAAWFDQALGFNQSNAGQLGSQIMFDAESAVQTGVTQYGAKFNQVIPITGANGRVIDVTFAWIRNNDGIIRLVTGIPAKL